MDGAAAGSLSLGRRQRPPPAADSGLRRPPAAAAAGRRMLPFLSDSHHCRVRSNILAGSLQQSVDLAPKIAGRWSQSDPKPAAPTGKSQSKLSTGALWDATAGTIKSEQPNSDASEQVVLHDFLSD